MTEESQQESSKLWAIFSSMKTGLALLGIIALVSGIGTLIPQEAQDPEKAQAVGKLWQSLGFTHLFSTPWFRLILGLLCLNLIVCSLQRFSGLRRLTFKPRIPLKVASVPTKNRVEITGDTTSLHQAVEGALKNKSYRLYTEDNGGIWGFYGLKHRWGYWGSLITHLAFVVLVLGALLGTVLGFKGNLTAGEGNTVPIKSIQLTRGTVNQDFDVFINSAQDRMLDNGERDNWYTDISILVKGKNVVRQVISVNHPLTYQGVTFYQSNFSNAARLTAEVKGQKIPVVLQNQGQNEFIAPGTD
ncbi:MAG: cytochrome c biogenesis protein ResB, partial [Desulfitobacteriaceae bacterium]